MYTRKSANRVWQGFKTAFVEVTKYRDKMSRTNQTFRSSQDGRSPTGPRRQALGSCLPTWSGRLSSSAQLSRENPGPEVEPCKQISCPLNSPRLPATYDLAI